MNADYQQELDRQIKTLLDKGYPHHTGIEQKTFLDQLEKLKESLSNIPSYETDADNGRLPFVIVVKNGLVPTEKAMTYVEREKKNGFVNMYPNVPTDFEPIDTVTIPESQVYLLIDIDRGAATRNVRPNEALTIILKEKRSPLTIDEGVAIVTQYPDFLKKNNCFSLLASRMKGNQRVPAIWITGEKTVRLGWCWDGNPHTWLGSASCRERLAV